MDGVPSVLAADSLVVSERDDGARVAPAPPRESPPPRLLFPDELEEGQAGPVVWRRGVRAAAYAVVGLLALGGLLNGYETAASRASPRALPDPAPGLVGPLERLDRAADTLGLAVAAFDIRAGLFERRQMGCPELSRGLIEVEERWIAYNLARKGAFALDSTRAARDRSQYSAVDVVERRFERAQCARP